MFDETIARRVPKMMMYLAIFQVITCISSTFFIKLNEEESEED